MERVRVLHEELARPHHAEARPNLIAKLRLDLVEDHRQLAVALDVAPRDVGDDLLVRGSDAEVTLVAILEAQQVGSELIPPSAFLPKLGRLNRRQQQLERAGAIHLLADDVRVFVSVRRPIGSQE